MKSTISPAAVALSILLISGCAAQSGPRAIRDEAPPKCQLDEHLVCTGKTASRLEDDNEEMEFCRCERRDVMR